MATGEPWLAHPYLVQEGRRRYCNTVRLEGGHSRAKAGDTVTHARNPRQWGPDKVSRMFQAGHTAYIETEGGLVVAARSAEKAR